MTTAHLWTGPAKRTTHHVGWGGEGGSSCQSQGEELWGPSGRYKPIPHTHTATQRGGNTITHSSPARPGDSVWLRVCVCRGAFFNSPGLHVHRLASLASLLFTNRDRILIIRLLGVHSLRVCNNSIALILRWHTLFCRNMVICRSI